jgi:hypothetical protein
VDVQGACLCSCVWSDSTTIVNNVMDKLSPSLMDKLTFLIIIFIPVDKLSSPLWTSYLSHDVCFVSKDMCVDCALC